MKGYLCVGGEMDGKWMALPEDKITITLRKIESLGSSPVDITYILFNVSPGGQCVLAPETYSQEEVISMLIDGYQGK